MKVPSAVAITVAGSSASRISSAPGAPSFAIRLPHHYRCRWTARQHARTRNRHRRLARTPAPSRSHRREATPLLLSYGTRRGGGITRACSCAPAYTPLRLSLRCAARLDPAGHFGQRLGQRDLSVHAEAVGQHQQRIEHVAQLFLGGGPRLTGLDPLRAMHLIDGACQLATLLEKPG